MSDCLSVCLNVFLSACVCLSFRLSACLTVLLFSEIFKLLSQLPLTKSLAFTECYKSYYDDVRAYYL